MKIKLDRTICDGFGRCAEHAPTVFSLDEWGYASLADGPHVPQELAPAVRRALLDCPVGAITERPDAARGPDAATGLGPTAENKYVVDRRRDGRS